MGRISAFGVAAVVIGLLLPAASAKAGTEAESFLQPISMGSPFPADGCGVPGQRTPGSVGEPSLAVNPSNPRNLIGVWQQDRFVVDGGALSNLVGVSKDGGRSWQQVQVPGLSRCTGGSDERTSDPWVSIGPDGTAYLATLTFTEQPALAGLAGPTTMRVSRSTDGGLSWGPPRTIVSDNLYDDRESVTADPRRAGAAYYVWVRRLGLLGEQGVEYFSRTLDGGSTWSVPRPITLLTPGSLPDPTLVKVTPDGTLVNLYLLANGTPFLPSSAPRVPWRVMAQTSTDQGASWSTPVQIADIDPPSAPSDPNSGAVVRAYNEISADVAPDGAVYVAWNVIRSSSSSEILFAKSTDGGRRWTGPRPVATPATQAFLPSLAVAGDGTVGVSWDDFRNDRPGSRELTTDVFFAHSHDGGSSWQESHVAGSFDTLTAAPTDSTNVAGRFLGDFQAIAGLPAGFGAVFAQGRPQAVHGGTDIFFARLDQPGGGASAGGGGSGGGVLPRRLRVLVHPSRVTVGRRRIGVFVSVHGRPVAGARVRLATADGRTDGRGRVTLVVSLRRRGVYRARATKPGLAPGSARLAVVARLRSPRFTG
ncbi:MAG: sialidase family protein [Thermoleophilaceae bacterium]